MPPKPKSLDQGECAHALMNAEVLTVMMKHQVPADWCTPEAVDVFCGLSEVGIPRHPFADPPKTEKKLQLKAGYEAYLGAEKTQKRRELSEAIRRIRAHNAELAVKFSQECPEKFWKVMAAISARVEGLNNSPEFQAALTLALHWDSIKHLDSAQLAKYLKTVLDLPITVKIVEHAKRRALDAGLLKLSSQ